MNFLTNGESSREYLCAMTRTRGQNPDASWSGSMLPRSLTVRGDAGARHELPASHQPSAAGTVASLAPRAPAPSHKLLSLSHSTRHHRPRASSGSDAECNANEDGAEPTASTSRCAQMAHVGRRGRTPNLYWLAPHDEQLRRHPRFVALPRSRTSSSGTSRRTGTCGSTRSCGTTFTRAGSPRGASRPRWGSRRTACASRSAWGAAGAATTDPCSARTAGCGWGRCRRRRG